MSFYRGHKEIALAIVGALAIIFLGLVLPLILSPKLTLLEKLGLMQVSFSAVAFFAVFIVLIVTISQFRKSMAKPEIKIYFSENRATEISVNIAESADLPVISLELWIVNNGNAVAKFFQVELDVPDDFNSNFNSIYSGVKIVSPRFLRGVNIRTISFYNIENYCFVGLPIHIISLTLERHKELYNKYPDEFKVPYRVFGDWAEIQEGELKVTCKRVKGVTNVTGEDRDYWR